MNANILKLIAICSVMWACSGVRPKPADPRTQLAAQRIIDRGTAALRQGDLEGAAAAFRVSYDIHENPAALDGLGAVAYLEQNYSAAERYFIGAYNLDRNYFEALGNLALLYETMGLTAKAKEIYEFTLKRNPQDIRVRNNFAAFLFDKELDGRSRAHVELAKAEVLASHPLIEYNLNFVEGREYGKE